MSVRIFPQWLIDDHPWLKDVIAAVALLQEFWHQYQNLVILVGLVLVARRLRKERLLLGERIETLGQIVKATRDDAEAILAQPQGGQSTPQATQATDDALANWEKIRTIWRDVRDRMELAIEGISRANVRRKYSKLSRSSYRAVITALGNDLGWGSSVANNLLNMDTMFHRLKFHPTRVTSADVAAFEYLSDVPNSKLPKLPAEEPQSDEPASQQQVQAPQAA